MNSPKHRTLVATLALAALAGTSFAARAVATDPQGVTSVTFGVARFDAIDTASKTDTLVTTNTRRSGDRSGAHGDGRGHRFTTPP